MKTKKLISPIAMLLLLMVATIGVTFAAFTFTKQGTVENALETSTIMLTYTEGKTGILLNEAYPMSDETGKMLNGSDNVFDFTVTATLGKSTLIGYEVTAIKIPITDMTLLEDNEVKLYLERAVDPDTTYEEVLAPTNFIPRDSGTEIGSPIGSMILDSGTFTNEGTTIHHYRLRLWVDESAEIPNGESRKYGVKINVYAKQDVMSTPAEQPVSKTNLNIKKVFTYNQTVGSDNFCVTGEEETCISLKIAPETYSTGTIIKYKVNDNEEKYFYVVADNQDTLTLQQRENLIYSTAWYAESSTNKMGPLTILPLLEEATKGWTNVLDQTYTMGTTIFKDNAFTGCELETLNCTENRYTLESRTAKARMITVQEAYSLGCTGEEQSCPIWMYNYLSTSKNYGGTVNQKSEVEGKSNHGYWTMNASLNFSSYANHISYTGIITHVRSTNTSCGARPVVVIKK